MATTPNSATPSAARSNHIDAVDVDVQLQALDFLDVRSLGRAGRVSRSWALLTDHMRKRPCMGTAVSLDPDTHGAAGAGTPARDGGGDEERIAADAQRAAASALDGMVAPPNLALVFSDSSRGTFARACAERVAAAMPPGSIVASVAAPASGAGKSGPGVAAYARDAAGVMGAAGPGESLRAFEGGEAVAVTLCNFPSDECDVAAFRLDHRDMLPAPEHRGADDYYTEEDDFVNPYYAAPGWSVPQLAKHIDMSKPWRVFLLFAVNVRVDAFAEDLQATLGGPQKVQMVGGYAAQASVSVPFASGPRVVGPEVDPRSRSDGYLVGVAIGGNVVFKSTISRATKPVSEPLIIDNDAYEHDGEYDGMEEEVDNTFLRVRTPDGRVISAHQSLTDAQRVAGGRGTPSVGVQLPRVAFPPPDDAGADGIAVGTVATAAAAPASAAAATTPAVASAATATSGDGDADMTTPGSGAGAGDGSSAEEAGYVLTSVSEVGEFLDPESVTLAALPRGAKLERGTVIRYYTLDVPSSEADIAARLEAARDACSTDSRAMLGGLLFTCSGRGLRFYRGRPNVETELWARIFPDAPCSGFFCGGEIGPTAIAGGSAADPLRAAVSVQGFTAVYGCFGLPRVSTKAPTSLHNALGDVGASVAAVLGARRAQLAILTRRCAQTDCGKAGGAMMRCARCKQYQYCSKDCQRKHWKAGHKAECALAVAAAAAASAAAGGGNAAKALSTTAAPPAPTPAPSSGDGSAGAGAGAGAGARATKG